MKTRYFRLLLVLMLCCVQQMAWAETKTVTIGTESTSGYYLPYGNFYKYSTTQTIYTPEEIGYTGTITRIAYYVASQTNYSGAINIYMGYRTNKMFASSSDCVPYSDLTLVYSSGLRALGSAVGWESISLATPFNYDGKKNLVVVVTKSASSYTDKLKYSYSTSPNGNSTLYRQEDSSSGYADASTTTNYKTHTIRPNTRFTIENAVVIPSAPSNQVSIGTGTDNTYTAPYCAMGKYSTSEMIYTPSELGSAGNIESVSFNLQSSTLTSYDDAVKIYMGYKSTTSFSNGTDYVSSNNMTLVYDGTRTLGTPLSGGIWETFKLDTPFRYNGTGNLVIAVCRASNNFNVTHRYYCTNASNSVAYRESDSESSYASGITSSNGFYVSSERPNIRLTKTNTSSTIRAKYNVYSTSNATRLLASTANVTEMIVDNVKLASPVDTYTFTTTGEHEVLLTQDVDPTLNISFKGANTLDYIELPTSITKIGNEAFRNCTYLRHVIANNNLTSIGNYAFSDCISIEDYPSFSSLTTIGAYAFQYNGFNTLDLSGLTSLTSIGEGAFSDSELLSIILPKNLTSIATGAFKDMVLQNISIDSNNSKYYSSDNCLIERSTQRLIVAAAFRKNYVNIPSGVRTLGAYAFNHASGTSSTNTLTLPSSVTSIEANAFNQSKFTEIVCEATTPPTLNASAFSDASYTTTVRVPLAGYRSYAANSQWNKHALKTKINYTDAVTNASELTVQNLEYYNYFASSDMTAFRPLFVPFTSDYSLWKSKVEIYAIDNVLQIDSDKDGQVDKMVLEVVPLEASDQVQANTPYVMKAKSSDIFQFTIPNAVIASTSNIEPLTCASTKATYTFTGTYASKSIAANTDFVMSNGVLSQKTSSYTLSPQTWYMTVTGRSASYELPVTSMEVKEAGTSMEQKITGITLSQSSLKVVAGANTVTLTASITPSTATNTSLNWTSSNTSVATVSSSGVVTPLTKGTTTITCAAKDGSGVTATCTVTVVARGDVDGNGTFTTADIQGCVKYVMNRDVTGMGYYRDAADYNNSRAINSTDAVAIVRLVLNGDVRYNAIRRKAPGQHVQEMATCLALNDVNIEAGHTATLDIDFAEQSNDYLSFQFDMILPSGVHVKEVLGGNKLNGHAVAFSERKEGFTRVICYNMQDETMHNITGSAIQIVLEADEVVQADDSHIRLNNIEIVCNDASTLCAESQTIGLSISNPTNINSLLSAGLQVTTGKRAIVLTAHSDVDVTIYSTASQLVYSGSLDKGEVKSINVPSGIYIVNGQKVMVK